MELVNTGPLIRAGLYKQTHTIQRPIDVTGVILQTTRIAMKLPTQWNRIEVVSVFEGP